MNPTKLTFIQSVESFAITTAFEIGLFDGNRVPIVDKSRTVPISAFAYDPSVQTVQGAIPSDLFEGVPSTNYLIGIRPVNDGGPGSWAFSPSFSVIGEPTSISNILLE